MARQKRIWYPGAVYHVMNRGVRKLPVFEENDDYHMFFKYMEKTRKEYPFTLHAICLMTNHYHFLLETHTADLGIIMQRIQGCYAGYYNYKYKRTGHLFESRYISCLIEDEKYFLEAGRYIHLNPLRAQLVKTLPEYEFSSYMLYLLGPELAGKEGYITRNNEPLLNLVTTERVLDAFGKTPRKEYCHFVEYDGSHADQEDRIRQEMREDERWMPL